MHFSKTEAFGENLVKGTAVAKEKSENALLSEYKMLIEQYSKLSEFNKLTIQELTQSLLRRQ